MRLACLLTGTCTFCADASGRYSPDQWARKAVAVYEELQANRIICESNFGGEMVAATLKATGTNARVEMVTASRGKQIRAEPIVSLYEQGKVHHVGDFPQLEDQCCGWEPLESSFSPDRLDALVWACTKLADRRAAFMSIDWAATGNSAADPTVCPGGYTGPRRNGMFGGFGTW